MKICSLLQYVWCIGFSFLFPLHIFFFKCCAQKYRMPRKLLRFPLCKLTETLISLFILFSACKESTLWKPADHHRSHSDRRYRLITIISVNILCDKKNKFSYKHSRVCSRYWNDSSDIFVLFIHIIIISSSF